MNTHHCLTRALLVVAALALPVTPAMAQNDIVRTWNAAALQAVRTTGMAPMPVARALAVVHTCTYDAWAAYDARAIGTHWRETLRRPATERHDGNKAEAISYAAHRALVDLFPGQRAMLFDPLMTNLGFDPTGTPAETMPAGIGQTACDAVLARRHHDGANQLGDVNGGTPYSDYTGYQSVNDPWALYDPNRWQPLLQANGEPQTFLAPHWGWVEPFALTSADQFMPPRPAAYPGLRYDTQARELVETSARLTDREKVIAWYWADGPSTETPPGHWNLFAQWVSVRDGHGIDEDVQMFFALGNALLDASIAAWDCKIAFDYVRPVTAIRFLYAGTTVETWAGPVDGSNWQSYIPTPPFAEYVSGHSTFSAAAATVLTRFTGSKRFGYAVTIPAGTSPREPGVVPAADITLAWKTFDEAADQAGLSRLFGGIHFSDGDIRGRHMGRKIGQQTWARVRAYLEGRGPDTSRRPLTHGR